MGALDCVTNNGLSGGDSTEVFTVGVSTNSLNTPKAAEEPGSGMALPRHFWWRVSVDVPILCIVLALVGLFEQGVLPCHQAGFFCNDPALSYTYTGDTVSSTVLVATVFLMAPVVIFLTELSIPVDEFNHGSRPVLALRRTLSVYRIYIFGLFANFLIVETMKGVVGNPRPTFFDICRPDAAKICNGTEFVQEFECTPTKGFSKQFQTDSYRSFPSGHTSLSVYAAFFIMWYLQARVFSWSNRSMFLVPALQLLSLTYAALCSLTRITDHRHHWWDVLAGFAIGVLTVYYAISSLLNNFKSLIKREESDANVNSVSKLLNRSRLELA